MSFIITNKAVPNMSRYFLLGQHRLQWVSSRLMLAVTTSMMATPLLLPRFGCRKTFSGSIFLLLVGGLAGGLSSNLYLVLAARVAEGLGSSVVWCGAIHSSHKSFCVRLIRASRGVPRTFL